MLHTIVNLYDVVREDAFVENKAENCYFSTNPYDYLYLNQRQ